MGGWQYLEIYTAVLKPPNEIAQIAVYWSGDLQIQGYFEPYIKLDNNNPYQDFMAFQENVLGKLYYLVDQAGFQGWELVAVHKTEVTRDILSLPNFSVFFIAYTFKRPI